MKERFLIQKSSTQTNVWVLTDTANGIVIQFEDGAFNESQRVVVLEDVPQPNVESLSHIMGEIGEWAARYHSSKCFKHTYGFEYDENEQLYLYRRKPPRWRLIIEVEVDKITLAATLRKAAEYLTKR